MFAILSPIFCAIAFLFLLLVSISVPTIKSIYLFYLTTATSPPLRINFGVFGYCIPSTRYGILGVFKSTSDSCSSAHLGWTFDGKVASYLGTARKIESTISKATTFAFVLHPIATALTLLTLLCSLPLLRATPEKPQRIASILTFGFGVLAVALTTIAFLVDVIVVAILKIKIRNATNRLISLGYGNAVWLTLAATLALWAAIIGACAGVFQRRRKNTY